MENGKGQAKAAMAQQQILIEFVTNYTVNVSI